MTLQSYAILLDLYLTIKTTLASDEIVEKLAIDFIVTQSHRSPDQRSEAID